MSDQHELEERVKTAQAECERLREENVRLRAMLSIHDPVLEPPARRHQALRTRLYLAAAGVRALRLAVQTCDGFTTRNLSYCGLSRWRIPNALSNRAEAVGTPRRR
jgi:hypothetical protein